MIDDILFHHDYRRGKYKMSHQKRKEFMSKVSPGIESSRPKTEERREKTVFQLLSSEAKGREREKK